MKESLEEKAREWNLTNLSFADFVNREGVKHILNASDATFVCFKHNPILETGSPNKFFDGLAAGKLIIVNFGGWVRDEIEKTHCGIAVDPEDPKDFVARIKPYITDPILLAESQSAARKLAEEKYSRVILSGRFVAGCSNSIGVHPKCLLEENLALNGKFDLQIFEICYCTFSGNSGGNQNQGARQIHSFDS